MHVYVVETDSMKCDICSREEAEWICVTCDNKMVCTDCDQKWHRHPKRLNHVREPLRSHHSCITSSLTSPVNFGNFVRTKTVSETESIENGSVSKNADFQKEFAEPEYVATVADVSMLSLLSDTDEMLKSEEFATSQQTGTNLLPKCVAEINEDLSYQSLLGIKDSFVPEHTSAGQNEHNFMPYTVDQSNSRHFSSLTSDFQSMLQSLQSKMDEVSSSVTGNGPNRSQDMDFGTDDWSLPQTLNKQTVASTCNSPAYFKSSNTTVKNVESSQPVTWNADKKHHAADIDSEVATLLAQTKYPPNTGMSGSTSAEHVKRPVNEQLSANVKPQNTGQPVDSKPFNITSATEEMSLTKGSVQGDMHPDGSNLPRARMQNMLPLENGLSDHKNVLSSERGNCTQAGCQDQQKSQTQVKERWTDSPGVFSRIGDGEDLGISARPSGGAGPDYHSKFSDIHDEVLLCYSCS